MWSEISWWQYLVFFAVAVYLFFFLPTMRRMRDFVSIFREVGRTATFFATLFFLVLAPIAAPFRWHFYRKEAREKEARRELLEREARKHKAQRLVDENNRRESMRKWWFEGNSPTLYTHTMNGVTAVLAPADYDAAEEATRRAVRNQTWPDEEVFVPNKRTVLFVVKSGQELLEKASRYPGGWLTDLDDLVKECNVTLVKRNDIFVPFLNESRIRFHKQLAMTPKNLEEALLAQQAPAEMRPIDKL
jgi:hypothetical protein